MATETEILEARRARAARLRERGVDLYPARVPGDLDAIAELVATHAGHDAGALEAARHPARIAGRITALRGFGRFFFATLQGDGERLQIWIRRDGVPGPRYDEFKLYEIGDFMWASGVLVRTRTGELTLDVADFGFLAKTLRPLPEKFHGLQDTELRYRQRYLDLVANPDARRMAVTRSRMIAAIRRYLDERGFLEVETPVLQPLYGGANARPFRTTHHTYDQELFLRISFELYLKRLVVGGLDRVYEIGRDFRNEGISRKHAPEFTMLELYQAFADYRDMMDLVEQMVAFAAQATLGSTRVERDGVAIDLAPPWPRRAMSELIREHALGLDIEEASDLPRLREALGRLGLVEHLRSRGLSLDPTRSATWGALVDELFSALVEPELVQPIFVVDYPVELSALAKRRADAPGLVERFEAFIGGMEIANAFSELNDPVEQRARLEAQTAARRAGDEEAQPLDEDFLLALEHGMPPCGGMGMGMDRLAMVLTGASHLREVVLFPHLRPREGAGTE